MDARTHAAHAARLGDRSALEQLVESSYPDVWRLCAALVDRDAADDLAQETILRAIHALPRFRGRSTAQTWILSIARHTCMDELRARDRRRRQQRQLATTPDRPPTTDPAEQIALDQLVSSLDPDQRAAFVLTQRLRLTYDEAATICDCPTGTIRSRVARAREHLIEHISAGQPNTYRIPNR